MKENYSIFKKFPNIEQAKELKQMLNDHGIDAELGDNLPPVDVTFSGSTLQDEYEVRIHQSDFNKAEEVLEKNAEVLLDHIDEDYYLYKFTDEELYEILLKPDEWNKFDNLLAQKLLQERGKPLDPALINTLREERIQSLAKPDENQKPWIIAGYIFSVLGGFLGLIIGYFLWTSKKTLPNGQKVYSYLEEDRVQGKYIFYIGLVVTPILFVLKFFSPLGV